MHYLEFLTRQESAHWKSQCFPKKQKVRHNLQQKKWCLSHSLIAVALFTNTMWHQTIINKEYCWDVFQELCSHISQKQQLEQIWTLHDDAWSHTARLVNDYLAFKGIRRLHHSPYGGYRLYTSQPVFPDDFLKNPYKRCRKNPYRLKKSRTFFDMGIKLKDFASTIEIRPTFLNLTISNYFININHIFKCNSIPYTVI